ncbi:MAG: hypothetical protein VB031_02770 [Eubacteriaceae bacterium]|nr:hypothetical protein [Eubacteriaceae bacterium]
MTKRKKVIIILLIAGFCAIEFPGILIIGKRTYPMIFGFPFLYGYLICCWMYMCSVLFYAWRTGWGRHRFTLRREAD